MSFLEVTDPADEAWKPKRVSVSDALGDLASHRSAWLTGLRKLRDAAKAISPDHPDVSYWQHEIDVYLRVTHRLADDPRVFVANRLAVRISEIGTDNVEALFDDISSGLHEDISLAIYDAAMEVFND